MGFSRILSNLFKTFVFFNCRLLRLFQSRNTRVLIFKKKSTSHFGKLHITKKVFGKRSECNSNSIKYFKNYHVWNAIIDQFQNNLTHKNLKTVIFYFFTKLQNSFEVLSWNKQCTNIKLFLIVHSRVFFLHFFFLPFLVFPIIFKRRVFYEIIEKSLNLSFSTRIALV